MLDTEETMEVPEDLITTAKFMAAHPAHGDVIHITHMKGDPENIFGVHSQKFLDERGPDNYTILHTERKS